MNPQTRAKYDEEDVTCREITQTEERINEILSIISHIESSLYFVLSSQTTEEKAPSRPNANELHGRLEQIYERLCSLKSRINL